MIRSSGRVCRTRLALALHVAVILSILISALVPTVHAAKGGNGGGHNHGVHHVPIPPNLTPDELSTDDGFFEDTSEPRTPPPEGPVLVPQSQPGGPEGVILPPGAPLDGKRGLGIHVPSRIAH